MTIKGKYPESAGGNFKVIDTIGVPHPYCIGSRLVAHAADRFNGMLGEAAIEDAEKHGIHCDICKQNGTILSFKEHKQALLIESKVDIDPVPEELKAYLLSIKEETEKNGYVGFAFKKYAPPKPPRTWPNYHLPPNYHLGKPGNACFLEPPGHPRYFVQAICTSGDNNPRRPPYYYLNGTGYENLEDVDREFVPLPYDHPRVKAWELEAYSHYNHCYHDEAEDDILIFPVPYYKLKTFYDDPRFSEEWRAKEKAAVKQDNDEIIARATKIAVPENHEGYRSIKKYYPEAQPRLDLINADKIPPVGNWWERLEECPSPDKCPGEYGKPHPVNGTWCQFCGWRAKE